MARISPHATVVLRPSGNHTATFAVNHNFFEQILDWSIGESRQASSTVNEILTIHNVLIAMQMLQFFTAVFDE